MRKVKEVLYSRAGWLMPAVGALAVLYKTYQYVQLNRQPISLEAQANEQKIAVETHPIENKKPELITTPVILVQEAKQDHELNDDVSEDEEKKQEPIELESISLPGSLESFEQKSLIPVKEKEQFLVKYKGSLIRILNIDPFHFNPKYHQFIHELVKYFLEQHANVNETGRYKAAFGSLNDDADSGYWWDFCNHPLTDYLESRSHSVLSMAIFNRQFDLVPLLIEAKANINYEYKTYRTHKLSSKPYSGYLSPLYIACLWFCYNFKENYNNRNDMRGDMEVMHVIRILIKQGADLTVCIKQLEDLYIDFMKNNNAGKNSHNLIKYQSDKVLDQLFPLSYDEKSCPPVTLKRGADSPKALNLFNLSYLYNELSREQISREIQGSEFALPSGVNNIIISYLDNRIEERRFLSLPILFRDPSFQYQVLPNLPDNDIMFFPVTSQEDGEDVCGYHKLKNLLLLTAFFHSYSYDYLLMMNETGDDSWFEKIFQYCSTHRQHTQEGQIDLSYHDGLKFLKAIFSGKINEKMLGIPETRTINLDKLFIPKNALSHFSAIRIADDHKTPLGGAMGEEGLSVAANIARIALARGRVEHPFALDMKEHSFSVFLVKEKETFLFAVADSVDNEADNLAAVQMILETLNQSKDEIKDYMKSVYNNSGIEDLLKNIPDDEKKLETYLNVCDQFLCFFDAYSEFFKPNTGETCFFYNRLERQAKAIINTLHIYRFPISETFSEIDKVVMKIYDLLSAKVTLFQEDLNHTSALFKKSPFTTNSVSFNYPSQTK